MPEKVERKQTEGLISALIFNTSFENRISGTDRRSINTLLNVRESDRYRSQSFIHRWSLRFSRYQSHATFESNRTGNSTRNFESHNESFAVLNSRKILRSNFTVGKRVQGSFVFRYSGNGIAARRRVDSIRSNLRKRLGPRKIHERSVIPLFFIGSKERARERGMHACEVTSGFSTSIRYGRAKTIYFDPASRRLTAAFEHSWKNGRRPKVLKSRPKMCIRCREFVRCECNFQAHPTFLIFDRSIRANVCSVYVPIHARAPLLKSITYR